MKQICKIHSKTGVASKEERVGGSGKKECEIQKKRFFTLIGFLAAMGWFLLLMLRWHLQPLDETNPKGSTRHKVQTSWNLTCPERLQNDGDEEEIVPLELPLQKVIPCNDRPLEHLYERRSDFWVLYNYVPATERVHCWETVTYTTHGDATFLDNLGPLVRRWRAPVSVALYAPGDDFELTLKGVRWARACLEPPLVQRYVTFHVLFDTDHMPAVVPDATNALSIVEPPNCTDVGAFWTEVRRDLTYRRRRKLQYPINVARNVARIAATTHFVFASDIELYPSPGLPLAFLKMLQRYPQLNKYSKAVFVVLPFEVENGASPPEDKSALVEMMRGGSAVPFHESVCRLCHGIPSPQSWVCAPHSANGILRVRTVARRLGDYSRWEPLYIGTNGDPLFDERLTWQGMNDKVVQVYTMCLLDYEFFILDNAFLVHRPGIKVPKREKWREEFINKTNSLIESKIKPELLQLYGNRNGCIV